jgi:hypothetical protein
LRVDDKILPTALVEVVLRVLILFPRRVASPVEVEDERPPCAGLAIIPGRNIYAVIASKTVRFDVMAGISVIKSGCVKEVTRIFRLRVSGGGLICC